MVPSMLIVLYFIVFCLCLLFLFFELLLVAVCWLLLLLFCYCCRWPSLPSANHRASAAETNDERRVAAKEGQLQLTVAMPKVTPETVGMLNAGFGHSLLHSGAELLRALRYAESYSIESLKSSASDSLSLLTSPEILASGSPCSLSSSPAMRLPSTSS